jgi:hypothetical protein
MTGAISNSNIEDDGDRRVIMEQADRKVGGRKMLGRGGGGEDGPIIHSS